MIQALATITGFLVELREADKCIHSAQHTRAAILKKDVVIALLFFFLIPGWRLFDGGVSRWKR